MNPRTENSFALRFRSDPRHFQICALSALLVWGVSGLSLPIEPLTIIVIVCSALSAEWAWASLKERAFDPRSPLISSLSLCLLARSSSILVLALAAVVAISSKRLLRVSGKHIFNPTAFALVLLLASGQGWVSPGQWGARTVFLFAVLCVGWLVTRRAERSDITWAFLISYGAVLLIRATYLGDPLRVPLHQLQSGALMVFAFFMISDPRTTAASRTGRVLQAVLVALGAGYVHFSLYQPNGFLWALVLLAPALPLIDRVFRGATYRWPTVMSVASATHVPVPSSKSQQQKLPRTRTHRRRPAMTDSRRKTTLARTIPFLIAFLLVCAFGVSQAHGFCGFYVAKADTSLFNQASQVVLVRDGDRTVITMSNDFRGEPDEFAMVVPVPTFISREQIHVASHGLIDHLDAFTSPRLVEYFDADPCAKRDFDLERRLRSQAPTSMTPEREAAGDLGVEVEATYTVGEYDIVILSAEQSDGLLTWLTQNGYRVPDGASSVLSSYLRQGMRFFVAKVNLDEQSRLGYQTLRPLQIAFESPKFMLPIRLGTVNAKGDQELFVYTLTRTGRVETSNYRTVRLPSDVDVPVHVKDEFDDFYRAMFDRQVEKERKRAVFLEYAWNMGWCDPCAADPLSHEELSELGVFWLGDDAAVSRSQAPQVFVTRLHLRYDRASFPEDLQFFETGDKNNFQGRYVIRHPFASKTRARSLCQEGRRYYELLAHRFDSEARTLASLTGWRYDQIRSRMEEEFPLPGSDDSVAPGQPDLPGEEREPWWKRLWPRG